MRIWRITAYVVASALLLALGFSFGATYVMQATRRASALMPIGPPPELSGLGSTIWELTGGLSFIEEFVWAMYAEEPTGLSQPAEIARHAYNIVANSNKLEELFSGGRPEYRGDPEYWLERWLYWNFIAGYLGPASPPEKEVEREISEALAGMKQFGEAYAPITYRLSVDAGLSEQEKNYYFEILHELQPDNGYIDVMLVARMHDTATVDDLLELLRTAGEKPEFRIPVAPLTEVLADYWVRQGEVVSPMLAFRYTEADPRAGHQLSFRKALRRIVAELPDEKLIAAMPVLKRALVRLSQLEPLPPGLHRINTPQMMIIINRAATEAYIRAGNGEAVRQCRNRETSLHRLGQYSTVGIRQLDNLQEMLKRRSGIGLRDVTVFSDFIRWLEFGDIEQMNGLVDKYDEFEYPPLRPGVERGGKSP